MSNKNSDNGNLTYIRTPELIELLVTAREQLNLLRQQRASKANSTKIDIQTKNCQAIRRELHGRSDCRDCYRKTGDWTFDDTIQYAALEILDDLHFYKKKNYFAIDNGLLLYSNSGYEPIEVSKIEVSSQFSRTIPDELTNPSEQQLLESGLDIYDDEIQTYLQLKAKSRDNATDTFQFKIGLRQIVYPVERPGVSKGLRIEIAPVLFWTIREFNRSMLADQPDPHLMYLRNKSYKQIFAKHHSITFSCPSALYAEVTIVTKDGKIALLEKSRSMSALSAGGRAWSCSIEEGLVWSKDYNNGYIDLKGTVKRCLESELQITSNHIVSIDFFGVAIEYTHLNTAVIGTVVLDILAKDMRDPIRKSPDFGLRYKFTSLEDAFQEYFSDANQTGLPWHPLARMRMLLSLIHHNFVDTEDEENGGLQPIKRDKIFISYSHKDTEWKDRVNTSLAVHFHNDPDIVWDDTKIGAGKDWNDVIQYALQHTKVAVLLVSDSYLSSTYIYNNEFLNILEAAESKKLVIHWLSIEHSGYKATPLAKIQCSHDNPDKPLSSRSDDEWKSALVKVADKIASSFKQ